MTTQHAPHFAEAITTAKINHLTWRTMLIEGGQDEFPTITESRLDDRCALGEWLDAVESFHRDIEHYETVRAIHLTFHLEASLYRAVRDDEGARRSQYHVVMGVSEALICALDRWALDVNASLS